MFFMAILFLFSMFSSSLLAMEMVPGSSLKSSCIYDVHRERFKSLLSEEERNLVREKAVEDDREVLFPDGITITEAEPFLYHNNTNGKILVYASFEIIKDLHLIDPGIGMEYFTNFEEEEYHDKEEEEYDDYTTATDKRGRMDYYQFSAAIPQLKELLLLKTEYYVASMGYNCDYVKIGTNKWTDPISSINFPVSLDGLIDGIRRHFVRQLSPEERDFIRQKGEIGDNFVSFPQGITIEEAMLLLRHSPEKEIRVYCADKVVKDLYLINPKIMPIGYMGKDEKSYSMEIYCGFSAEILQLEKLLGEEYRITSINYYNFRDMVICHESEISQLLLSVEEQESGGDSLFVPK